MVDSRIPTRKGGSVDADVDGQLIVLSPKDYAYLTFGGSGVGVWHLIDGVRTIDEIVEALEDRFSAPAGVIRSETVRFLSALVVAGLVADLDAATH